MKRRPSGYRAFLVRVWTPGEGTDVRVSIRDVETGETRSFVDLESVTEWLHRETRIGPVHPSSSTSSTRTDDVHEMPADPRR